MQLRSSRLLERSSDVPFEQSALNHGVSDSTSTEQVSKFESERDISLISANRHSASLLSRPEPARRYNLRSRKGEISPEPTLKNKAALSNPSNLNAQKRIKRHKGSRVSPTDELRTCPICVECKVR